MIAALIGVALLAAVTQFVYYCRSALASAKGVELSDHVAGIAGLRSAKQASCDFERFFELVQLCPAQRTDASQMRAVAVYYGLLRALERTTRGLTPAVSSWARHEQQGCTYFAAVVLDRRISSSRNLFLQQAINRL